jgi:predicted SnoaL-like aldol condensation-catalyzing enzyme
MSDLENNKRTVVEFYELAFNGKQPEQAVEKYVGSQYLQHNPQAPDGPEAFIGFVKAFPEGSVDIRRVFADGDIVVTHSLLKVHARGSRHRRRRLLPSRGRQGRGALGRVAAVPRGEREPAPDVLIEDQGRPRATILLVVMSRSLLGDRFAHDPGREID